MSKIQEEGLKRVIGVRALAINAVNLTVGAGIFALPAVVYGTLGANAVWAYVLCALLLSLVLLCFAEVGSKMTLTGGVYAYVEAAFGPLAGFLVNTLFWLGFAIMADAAVANVIVDNLAILFPAFSTTVARIFFMALIFGGIAALNVVGVQESSRFIVFITVAKILPLAMLVVAGIVYVAPANLAMPHAPDIKSLGEGAIILFFAFGGGAEATLTATGEIKNPRHTIPRGLLLGVLMVFVIYLAVQLIAQGVLGPALAAEKEAPLVAVAQIVLGDWGRVLLIAATGLSCFGLISGDILVSSRLPYAAARDGLLPSVLAKVHPRFATPYVAIIVYAGVGFVLSITGSFRQLAILSSASILMIYVGVILATIKLRAMKREGGFTIPGGLAVPILALVATFWFLTNLSWTEIAAALLFIGVFVVIYFVGKNRLRGSGE